MEEMIRIAGFNKSSAADGPGIRSVLFFQGCSRGCPDCHNQNINNKEGGLLTSVEEMVSFLKKNCHNKKLTISGGEPLEQPEGLRCLMSALKDEGFDLCLYTGFDRKFVPPEIIENLHYLKTGIFKKEAVYPPKPFVGSNNQIFTEIEIERMNDYE